MESVPARYLHQNPKPARPPRHLRGRLWRWLLVPVVAVLLVAGFGAVSVIGAWSTPGNESFQAKWADWLRSHHAASIARAIEQYYYDHHVPPKGGQPRGLNAVPAPNPRVPSPTRTATTPAPSTSTGGLPPPRAIAPVVNPALPGEGQWVPAGTLVHGQRAMYVAQFRADTIYTSQITSAVWIDPTLLRVSLVPGSQEPGGTWSQPPDVSGAALATIVAAFNGGFRMQDAQGGFYLDGRQAVPLRPGAASVVIHSNGGVDVGAWGSEVRMSSDVTAVLQNLVPIVDHGQIAPDATYNDTRVWGATLGANTVVARSGIGVTSTGALVYVAGPALTARSLAESLQRAGAVRAMSLDINPEWVTFNFYVHPDPANPTDIAPAKLYPQMQRPADRYLGPTRESRDFFAVSTP